jgi:hypothetical protein
MVCNWRVPHFSFVTRLGLPVLLAANALAAVAPEGATEREFSSQPVPALIAFARTRNIPLEQIDIAGSQRPRKGDQVTLLFTLVRGEAREQWVATLTGDELTPAEAALKPQSQATIYTFTGQKLQFERTRTALNVYLAGPFSVSGTNGPSREPLEVHHRTLVTAEYLVHGLEPFAHSAMDVGRRMHARGWTDRDGYAAGFGPFSEGALQVGRRFAEKFQLTAEEERLENEAYLAMVSFFDTARGIPEFNNLAKTAIDFPSLWSLTKNFGLSSTMLFRWVDVRPIEPEGISIKQPTYRFPLTVLLNQTVATRASLVVTASHPPLHISAGILAIIAEHPTDRTRRFVMQVIAARRGSDSAKP